jgi:hypothetical protein
MLPFMWHSKISRRYQDYGFLGREGVLLGTNVSEKHAASIFRV